MIACQRLFFPTFVLQIGNIEFHVFFSNISIGMLKALISEHEHIQLTYNSNGFTYNLYIRFLS